MGLPSPVAVVAAFLSLCTAQQLGSAPASSANVAPAAATVPAPSSKQEAAYFSWENVQLTQPVLTNLTSLGLSDIGLFGFATPANSHPLPVGQCKAFPGDSNYPSSTTWKVLDLLTGHALIKTVPLAAPCYQNWPQYNPAVCADITARWNDAHIHVSDPSSTQWPLYEGLTCLPPGMRVQSNTCTLGGYASYSINVSTVAQIQLALNFARLTNVRLVVKNTGHDFADKSIGAGALSLWTHNLKDLKYIKDYSYGTYRGPAFKVATGVATEDIYALAEQVGVTAVGGVCRTVALAGGYIAGGGHSPMASLVGMGADQVLSMEVVLPDGRFVTASPTQNQDLFWGLRGGGGSTFGVVTSLVIRAYPKIPVTTMTFNYTMSATLSPDTFWAGVRSFMTYFTTFVDAGTFAYFLIAPNGVGGFTFAFDPFWGGNKTLPQMQALVKPYLADLAKLGIVVAPVFTEYPSLRPAWLANYPPENVGGFNNHAGSRLFPRANFVDAAKLNATLAAVRYAVEGAGVLVGYNIKAAAGHGDQDNAVNPAWRKTVTHFILPALWDNNASEDVIAAASKNLTTNWIARWRDVSPGAGAYMSESDINEPNFQQAFYGDNYKRLYAMKQQYDPTGLFYAPTGVGSEDWYITGQHEWIPTQNGRLCRK